MNENIYLRVVVLVIIAPTALRAGILDEVFGGVTDAVCAVAAGPDIERCGNDFTNEIQSVGNQPIDELKTRKLCCSFNHLRDCINDAIGDKCGNNKDTVVKKLISLTVGTAKSMTSEDCTTYNGSAGDFLCLNDYILIVIGIGLIVLFVFVCSATIRMCCGSKRSRMYGSRGSAQFILLPQHNSDKNRY